ncbi:hypothetical protein [Microbacterium sp. BK668]|uniref:hypothetical protein n=1 Tax=Microbacterium sp. BK668 TaxID=2512118 RepID=UPI00105F4718|nr:hypothetical protein [Microbacterium sp. BK668]TDN91773.1 hypothetical protein EV279_1278 [Microbacterium sp. BK668]
MTEPLTPREHADVRDLLLAGSERMKPNGILRAAVPVSASALVMGLVGIMVAINLAGDPSQPAVVPEPTATATGGIPSLCVEYGGSSADNAPGGDAIAVAAATADLGEEAILSPGVQVRDSTESPGTLEATARVCGDGLDRPDLIAAATAIAKAIYSDPAHARLSTLTVSAWRPISPEAIAEDENLPSVSTAYQTHDWDAAADALVTAWE